jgi:hypothetical protein
VADHGDHVTPETLLALVSGQSIAWAEPVGGRVPQWTLVEAGFGMGELSSPYLLAFWYRYGRDPAVYRRLYEKLREESIRLAESESWGTRIAGRKYLDSLVSVVLAEEWLSYPDRQRLLDQLESQWPDGVYYRKLVRRQHAIATILDRWCSIAHEHIARRIRLEDVDLEEEVA